MNVQQQIERDLKAALLSGDKPKVEVLKGLKNSLLYEAVNQKSKPSDLQDDKVLAVLAKEAKKRVEAAEIYEKANESERAAAELAEKSIIEAYLPEQLGEDKVRPIVEEEVGKVENPSARDMGRIIGAVRSRLQGQADGALIARLVKQALESK